MKKEMESTSTETQLGNEQGGGVKTLHPKP